MLVRKAGRAVASSTASWQRSAVVVTAMGLCSLALVHCASSDNASSSGGDAGAPSRAGSNGGFVVAGSGGQSAQGGASQSGTAGSAAASTAGASNGCMADADCGVGKICEAASCQAAQCAVDADCGATQSCAKQALRDVELHAARGAHLARVRAGRAGRWLDRHVQQLEHRRGERSALAAHAERGQVVRIIYPLARCQQLQVLRRRRHHLHARGRRWCEAGPVIRRKPA